LFLLLGAIAFTTAETASGPAATSSIRLFAGPSLCLPVTWAEDNPTLPHFGWGLGGGAELALGRVIAARLGIDVLWIGSSSVSPEGILYRSWEGMRFSLAAGYSFPIGRMSLDVTAGGALTAADYRGTALVFAYPSLLARADLDIPVMKQGIVRVGLPLELMFRGAYMDFAPGLAASFAWSFPLGAQR